MYFIYGNFFPAQHVNRALLFYVMLQGWKINVGDQILYNMRKCAGGHTRGVSHPHLITEMCRKVVVQIDHEELTYPLKSILNDVIFKSFYNQCTSRVQEKNEQVVTHQEYTRGREILEPMEEPQPIPPRVQRKRTTTVALTSKEMDLSIEAYDEYNIE